MSRIQIRRVGVLTAVLAVAWLSGCSDGTGPDADLTQEQAVGWLEHIINNNKGTGSWP